MKPCNTLWVEKKEERWINKKLQRKDSSKNLGDRENGCTTNKKRQIMWERKYFQGRGENFTDTLH